MSTEERDPSVTQVREMMMAIGRYGTEATRPQESRLGAYEFHADEKKQTRKEKERVCLSSSPSPSSLTTTYNLRRSSCPALTFPFSTRRLMHPVIWPGSRRSLHFGDHHHRCHVRLTTKTIRRSTGFAPIRRRHSNPLAIHISAPDSMDHPEKRHSPTIAIDAHS